MSISAGHRSCTKPSLQRDVMSQRPHPPAAVLFDMDGLLVDTEPLWFMAESTVMARMGVRWEQADQSALIGGPMSRAVAYMIGRAGGGHDALEVARSLKSEMASLLAKGPIAWMPGARELVVSLRQAGIPRALVSSSGRDLVNHVLAVVLDEVGDDVFDLSVAGDEVEHTKPHPAPYLFAAAKLGVSARHCVVLEDSRTGVTSGLAAGCHVVAVPHATSHGEPIVAAELGSDLEEAARERLSTASSLHDLTVETLADLVSGNRGQNVQSRGPESRP